MTIWFVLAVIVKIAASATLVFGTRTLASMWAVAVLEREKLTPRFALGDTVKMRNALLFIRIVQIVCWAGAALIALAVWLQA